MRSTNACGVGTQMTSLPSCPTIGLNSFVAACADAPGATKLTAAQIRTAINAGA
ncbi:hypothetical protein D3C83_11200 [compost metagenome]